MLKLLRAFNTSGSSTKLLVSACIACQRMVWSLRKGLLAIAYFEEIQISLNLYVLVELARGHE
jgi:hypothetical protein